MDEVGCDVWFLKYISRNGWKYLIFINIEVDLCLKLLFIIFNIKCVFIRIGLLVLLIVYFNENKC